MTVHAVVAHLILGVSASAALAAPSPGTASSKLVSPHLGLFRSPFGFQLSAGDSGWLLTEGPTDNKAITTLFRAPDLTMSSTNMNQVLDRVAIDGALVANSGKKNTSANAASLSVRVDQLSREVPLEKYVQRWIKEYPKYGFDLISSRPFVQSQQNQQNKQRGFVLDLINRDIKKQIRQVVFLKEKTAVILTCRDQATTFRSSLKSCNQIIRTFAWTE